MNPLICAAIKQQRLIELFYECGYRLVEPHVYGLNANASNSCAHIKRPAPVVHVFALDGSPSTSVKFAPYASRT